MLSATPRLLQPEQVILLVQRLSSVSLLFRESISPIACAPRLAAWLSASTSERTQSLCVSISASASMPLGPIWLPQSQSLRTVVFS